MAVGGYFHPRCHRDILHLRSAFPSGLLNRREVQFSLAGQALSLIYTPPNTTFHEKSGLASLAALSDADAADLADVCLNGTEKQRLGAANVYAANLATSRFREHCAQALLELFNDDSRLVRDAAAAVIRQFSGTERGEFADVAEGFVNSAAAQENWTDMLDALVETTSGVPDLALLTCERVLSTSSGEGLQSPVAYRMDLVSQVLLRVYTDGTNAIRSRALDLIDWSLKQNVYGTQRALAEHDRAWGRIT